MGLFETKKKRVFLDFASATPTRGEVLDAMMEYSRHHFANPSALYEEARKTKEIMQQARGSVAGFLNTAKERIVFTSGGTEANNIAILGVFEGARKAGIKNPHIISVLTEHPSAREVFSEIERRGGEVALIVPDTDGLITADQVIQAIKENTVLVSVMYVNNEIGVVQPIREISQALKSYKLQATKATSYPFFHTDACQSALFYTLDVSTLGVDLLTLDGLKVGGPVGVGCLYVKNDVVVSPVMFGGGQENGLRSGTENVAGMIGFAQALTLAKAERKELSERLETLRDYFIDEILKRFPNAELNGSQKHRSPNNVNVCFPGLDSEYLVVALDTYGVCASYSSSCRTLKEDSSSYVVESLGKKNCALSSIRFTLGRTTTKSYIDFALSALEKTVAQVKK
jgi:cysteine desulfurase